jgi:hypothetical protein
MILLIAIFSLLGSISAFHPAASDPSDQSDRTDPSDTRRPQKLDPHEDRLHRFAAVDLKLRFPVRNPFDTHQNLHRLPA